MLRRLLEKITGSPRSSSVQTMGNISGAAQQVQAGANASTSQTTESISSQQHLPTPEIIALLEKLSLCITSSDIPQAKKSELLDYLSPAQREMNKKKPNKELIKVNLKQVSESMKVLNETTEAGKSLWTTGTEFFSSIAPWIGVTTSFFGF